jgi:acetamidase/formamidase
VRTVVVVVRVRRPDAICSEAVDLEVSEMVDVPSSIVAACLPLDVLTQ